MKTAVLQIFAVVQRTLTSGGWFLTIASVTCALIALTFQWAEAAAVAGLGFVFLALAVFFVLTRRDYDVTLGMLKERVTVGDDSTGTVTVTNAGRHTALPGRIEIPMGDALAVVHVPTLRPGSSYEHQLLLPTQHRAVVPIGPVRAVRTDPWQLLRVETLWPQEFVMYVHPVISRVPLANSGLISDLEGTPSTTIADVDISFHALREYVPGDSVRQINWKATAKTGTLMVRQFERTLRSRMAGILCLRLSDFADNDEFELAVSIAGSIGVSGLAAGREFDIIVPEPISQFDTAGLRTITSLRTQTGRVLLDSLSEVDPLVNSPRLVEVAELASQLMNDLSVVFLICGSVPSLAELRSSALKFPEHVAVVAVVADLAGVPRVTRLHELTIVTVAVLDDLRQLLVRGAQS